jgi:hypothetical protein
MQVACPRTGMGVALLGLLLSGCLSEETIRKIEGTPGQEGTGIMFSRVPEIIRILATYEATPQQRQAAEAAAQRRLAESRPPEGVRYLALQTPPEEQGQGAVSVMLWDTESAEIVGNNVYDLAIRPRPDGVAMIDQFRAQFVASN